MKILWVVILLELVACQKSEVVSVYTGNEAKYGLIPASQYTEISGTVTLKERKDGSTTILVQLSGTKTNGDEKFPVHLHQGDIASNGSTTLALLSPVFAKTGISETVISQLGDETKVTYTDLLKLSAYLNVHLSDYGNGASIILAAGNIGVASSGKIASSSRIGLCTTGK